MSSFNLLRLSVFIKTRTFIILFLLQETRGDQRGEMQDIDGRNLTTNLIRETNHDRQGGTDFNYNFHLVHNEKSQVPNGMFFKESTDEFENFKRFKRTDEGGGLSRDATNGKVAMEFKNNETEMLKPVNYEGLHANQSVDDDSNSYSALDISVIGSPLKDIDSFTTENWIVTEGSFVANTTECPDLYRDPELCNMTQEEYTNTILEYIYPSSYEWIFIVTYAIVFVIGLVGNALVCVAVYRNHSMRTVTNYFIVNLAVADFMVILICLPSTVIWDVTKTWFFGNALCRIILYFQSVSVTVSVLTLTFISVDRWYAICFPLKFKSTTGRAKTAILIIWLLSLTFNVPEFVVLEVSRQTGLRFDLQYFMQCAPTWSKDSDLKWHIIKAIFLYTFPLLLMMIAYCQIVRVLWRSDNIPGHSETNTAGQNNINRRTTMSIHANASTEGQLRSRRKAAKMLVAVVAMFAVCYLPVHVLSVLRYAFDMPQTNFITFVSLMSHVLCYVNSAINPLIYNFMSGFPGFSGKFRREFHRSFFNWPCWCCGAPTSDRNGTSFAPIGSSRAGTSRTIIRRNDSCVSYRLTHLSPSTNCNSNSLNRTNNTSFIENNNSGNARKINNRFRDHSISDNAARLTLTSDVKD